MRFNQTSFESRIGLVVAFVISSVLIACGTPAQANRARDPDGAARPAPTSSTALVRIGHLKNGALPLLKARGGLDERLRAQGVAVRWIEFPAAPQALEALNTAAIDFGYTSEVPPIFAQAASAEMSYVAAVPGNPKSEAILVPRDSAIQSIADLKGKKVALNKGSNVHYLLVKALEQAGLPYTAVQTVFLAPADARAAFQEGRVDAWCIWQPALALAIKDLGARVLRDGAGLVENRHFYVARRAFTEKDAPILKVILEEIRKVDDWSRDHPAEVAQLLSKLQGVDVGVLEQIARGTRYGVERLDDRIAAEQQKIADAFAALGLIPRRLAIKEAIWAEEGATRPGWAHSHDEAASGPKPRPPAVP